MHLLQYKDLVTMPTEYERCAYAALKSCENVIKMHKQLARAAKAAAKENIDPKHCVVQAAKHTKTLLPAITGPLPLPLSSVVQKCVETVEIIQTTPEYKQLVVLPEQSHPLPKRAAVLPKAAEFSHPYCGSFMLQSPSPQSLLPLPPVPLSPSPPSPPLLLICPPGTNDDGKQAEASAESSESRDPPGKSSTGGRGRGRRPRGGRGAAVGRAKLIKARGEKQPTVQKNSNIVKQSSSGRKIRMSSSLRDYTK